MNDPKKAIVEAKNPHDDKEYVFCRYVIRNGKRYYPKNAKFFRFPKKK